MPAPVRHALVARPSHPTGAARRAKGPASLRIGSAHDVHEREADQAADRVAAGSPALAASPPPLSRPGAGGEAAPESVSQVLAGPGRALDAALRRDLEPRFGHDFSRVRVHSGEAATRSAGEMQASAYTVGNDVVLGRALSPSTREGRHLMAHELAHVVQQSRLPPSSLLVQRQIFAPPPQSGGFQRGFDQDMQYLLHPTPEETERRRKALARERALNEALKPFKDALLGEWEDDPSTTGIVLDTVLGLIPIVDQGLDIRDIIAHIYMMSEKREYDRPMRWIGLVLTLLGVVPEIGSAVKGVAKVIIKKGAKALPQLAEALAKVVKMSSNLGELASRFRKLMAENWSSWVTKGKSAFTVCLATVEAFLEKVGSHERLAMVRKIRELAAKKLDEAFEKVRRELEDAMDALSPQLAHADGPGGRVRLPDAPKPPKPLQTTGSGAGARNTYPDFKLPSEAPSKVVREANEKIIKEQAQRLSKQLGLRFPEDRVLEAPWVGRVYDKKMKPNSYGTSEGWARNESRYWTLFKEKFGADYALLGKDQTVTRAFAKKWGWNETLYEGQKLVHHHLENGPFVVPIPESLHKRLSGLIHGKATVIE